MSASDVEHTLQRLAGQLEWPPTPRFRAVPQVRATSGGRRLLAAAILAAAALAAFAAAAVASDRLLHSVTVQRVERLPSPVPSPAVDPLLGTVEPSVSAAAADAGFPVAVPAALGPPDAVTLRRRPAVIVSLVYRPQGRPEALVSEYRGSGSTQFAGKLAGPGTSIQSVDVGGSPGVWLAGSPHEVLIPNGGVDELRLATNTLIWERGGMTYRLESAIPLAEALRIAGTMR